MSIELETTVLIKGEEVDCLFEFDYQPAEAMTDNYPGCGESVEIEVAEVEIGGVIFDAVCDFSVEITNDIADQLTEKALAHIREQKEKNQFEREVYLRNLRDDI